LKLDWKNQVCSILRIFHNLLWIISKIIFRISYFQWNSWQNKIGKIQCDFIISIFPWRTFHFIEIKISNIILYFLFYHKKIHFRIIFVFFIKIDSFYVFSMKIQVYKACCSVARLPLRIKILPAGHRETMKSILFLQSYIKSNLQFDLVKNFKFPFLRSHTEEVCTSGLHFFISIRKLLLWRFPISLKPIGLNIILSIRFRTSSFKQKIQPFQFLI